MLFRSNVSNLRPVAAGLQRLSQGKQEQFTQRYLGLEGREALGAWTILPEQGLLVANEWPRELGISGRSSWIGKIGIVLSWLSFLSWGIALAESKGSSASDPVKPIFPTSRLDDDALEYLEQAKAKTDEAMEFARAQEALADRVTRERAEILGRARELEARYKLLESFQSRVLPKLTGKQVLAELGRLVSENFPGMSVGVYRYSPSSFSLVPEALFDVAGLGESAKSFLQDTRIFLGNPQLIPNVLSTEAFAKWNRNRQRHMPNHDTGFRVFPFTAQGNRGALLVLFEEGINNQRELEPSFQFMDQLIQKAATFCDSLGPLLQSSYAKANAGAPLASAPNGVGNRPRPT